MSKIGLNAPMLALIGRQVYEWREIIWGADGERCNVRARNALRARKKTGDMGVTPCNLGVQPSGRVRS